MTDKPGVGAALLLLAGALGLPACTEPGTEQQPGQADVAAAEPASPESRNDFVMGDTASPGGQVYMQACAACHEGGVDRAPQRAMLLLMSPESIHRSLTVGVMQAQAAALTG